MGKKYLEWEIIFINFWPKSWSEVNQPDFIITNSTKCDMVLGRKPSNNISNLFYPKHQGYFFQIRISEFIQSDPRNWSELARPSVTTC